MGTSEAEPKIVVVDFESQLAGVIAARYGDMGVDTEVIRHDLITPADLDRFSDTAQFKGFWLAGGKHDVNQDGAPTVPEGILKINEEQGTPIMASCYGAQALAVALGGKVSNAANQELGRTKITDLAGRFALGDGTDSEDMLMSHRQVVQVVPAGAEVTALSPAGIAGYEIPERNIFAQQGHVESPQTTHGKRFFDKFAKICDITPSVEAAANYIEKKLADSDAEIIRQAQTGFIEVLLSGGIDSSAAAMRINRALKAAGLEHKAFFTYVETGTMRDNDRASIDELMAHGLPVEIVDETELFLDTAIVLTPEEAKREKLSDPVLPKMEDAIDAHTVRLIYRYAFVRVHQKRAHQIRKEHGPDTKIFLVMGTNAADIAESEAGIKAHHNQGIEDSIDGVILPFRFFFKGQIRKVGEKEGLSSTLYKRQPFPGPSLGIRVVPSEPEYRVGTEPFEEADQLLQDYGRQSLQDFKFSLTPDRTRAVRGDEGSNGYSVILHPKNHSMPWSEIPEIAREIGNNIHQIGRIGIAPLNFTEFIPHHHVGLRRNRRAFELARQLETYKDLWLREVGFEDDLSQHFIALTDSSLEHDHARSEPTAWLRLFQSGGWGKSNEDMMTGIVPFPGVDDFPDYDRALHGLAWGIMRNFRVGGFILDATEKPFGTVERI